MPAAPLVGRSLTTRETCKRRTHAVKLPLIENPTSNYRTHGRAAMPSERPFDRLYLQLHGKEPPATVARGESDAALLSPGRGFMETFHYTMQQQVGCPAACVFCY